MSAVQFNLNRRSPPGVARLWLEAAAYLATVIPTFPPPEPGASNLTQSSSVRRSDIAPTDAAPPGLVLFWGWSIATKISLLRS
jgi:hypothetical protein